MGFNFKKAFKIPKIKIKAPKIKADPGKLISNVSSGATKAFTDVMIKPGMDVVGTVVGGAGQIMQQPGAGAVLGAGLTAFGVPGAGMLSGLLGGSSSGNSMSPSPAPMVSETPTIISAPESKDGIDSSILIMGGIGGLVLIIVLFLGLRKR